MGVVVGLHGVCDMCCSIDVFAGFCAGEIDKEFGVG